MNSILRLIAVAALLAALWAFVEFSGLKAQFALQAIRDGFARNQLVGLLLFSLLFALGNLVQIPGWVFLAAAVLTLGRWWGGAATYVAACVACFTTFWIVRLIGADALRAMKGRLAQRLFARLDAQPLLSVAALRMVFQTVPALNVALALSGVRFRDYALGTLLGLPLPILAYDVFFDVLAHAMHWPVPTVA